MENRQLTCIGCPMGCQIEVGMQDGKILSVQGFSCKRGEAYARKEVTHPERMVTTSVPVSGGTMRMVSVKTTGEVPKEKVRDCVRALKGITVKAPVYIGDIVADNLAGTGISAAATRNVERND